MSLSYNNLKKLVSVLNSSNPSFKEKYDVKFSDRSALNVDEPPNLNDLTTLLNNFVGESNMEWVGSNCSYTESSCSKIGNSLEKMVMPGSGPYSKCEFDNDDLINSGSSFIPSGGLSKQWDCPTLQSCPSSSSNYEYHWEPVRGVNTIFSDDSAYNATLSDIGKPGQCVKKYINKHNAKTNDPNDIHKDPNSSPVDGMWNCIQNNTVLDSTPAPTKSNKDSYEYKIRRNRNEFGSEIAPTTIQHECAVNPIHYNNESKKTNPTYKLGYSEPDEYGNVVPLYSGETRDCKINKTYAHYVRKGSNSIECQPEERLYPGDDTERNYDIPLEDNQNRAEWWNENSCVWVNSFGFNPDLNTGGNLSFEPQILNGACTYGDFGQFGSDWSFNTVDDNGEITSVPAVPESGIVSGSDANDIDTNKSISNIIQHDKLKNIADKLKDTLGTAVSPNLFPGINYRAPDSKKCQTNAYICAWVNENDTIAKDSNSYSNTDIKNENIPANDITGKFKLFAKNDDNNDQYSEYCYYQKATGSNAKYLLEDGGYRAVDINNNRFTECENSLSETKKMMFQYTDIETDQSTSLGPGWYTSDSSSHIDSDARGNLNLIKSGSSIDNQGNIKILGSDTVPTKEGSGYGYGEYWNKVNISQFPEYVNTEIGILNSNEVNTNTIKEELQNLYGENTPEYNNILSNLSINNNNTFYYKMDVNNSLFKNLNSSVDAVAKLEHAWVSDEFLQITGGNAIFTGSIVASNTHSAKFGPEKLFDNKVDLSLSGGGGWHNRNQQYPLPTNPAFLRITFNSPKEVIRMKMLAREGHAVQGPKNYQVFGTNKIYSSNTDFVLDSDAVLLLDKFNTPLTSGSYSDNIAQNQINHPTLTITDNFTNTGSFKNYIIKIKDSHSNSNGAVSIMELFLFIENPVDNPAVHRKPI